MTVECELNIERGEERERLREKLSRVGVGERGRERGREGGVVADGPPVEPDEARLTHHLSPLPSQN